jgi:hypothetical protein
VPLTTCCLDCGTRTKGSRCVRCRARRAARRGTTLERGYGWTHQQLREDGTRSSRPAAEIAADATQPIHPSEPWDLDHDDDRSRYLGPAPARCNRKHRKSTRQREVRPGSG